MPEQSISDDAAEHSGVLASFSVIHPLISIRKKTFAVYCFSGDG